MSELNIIRCDICGGQTPQRDCLRVIMFCPNYQEMNINLMQQLFSGGLFQESGQTMVNPNIPPYIIFDKRSESFDICRNCLIKSGITINNNKISIDEFLYIIKAQLVKSIGNTGDLKRLLEDTYKNIVNGNNEIES